MLTGLKRNDQVLKTIYVAVAMFHESFIYMSCLITMVGTLMQFWFVLSAIQGLTPGISCHLYRYHLYKWIHNDLFVITNLTIKLC